VVSVDRTLKPSVCSLGGVVRYALVSSCELHASRAPWMGVGLTVACSSAMRRWERVEPNATGVCWGAMGTSLTNMGTREVGEASTSEPAAASPPTDRVLRRERTGDEETATNALSEEF
jgi:hypothetical protein